MPHTSYQKQHLFQPLSVPSGTALPTQLNDPFKAAPDDLAKLAVSKLQHYLSHQSVIHHNFGLQEKRSGPVIGKMFGVLVVKHIDGRLGYLSAFSGKLANANFHDFFVPPIFDSLEDEGFLSVGLREVSAINKEIEVLKAAGGYERQLRIVSLKQNRKLLSGKLQGQLFDAYNFINHKGEYTNVRQVFEGRQYKNPPAGAGECAAPKLLQYAFQEKHIPISIAEFWWGQSPKSENWMHQSFYPACEEKCRPILEYMLDGLAIR